MANESTTYIPFDSDQAAQARALLGAASSLDLPADTIRVSGRGFRVPPSVFEEYMEVTHGDGEKAEAEKAEAEKAEAEKAEAEKAEAEKAPKAKKTTAKKAATKKPTKPSLDDVLGETEE